MSVSDLLKWPGKLGEEKSLKSLLSVFHISKSTEYGFCCDVMLKLSI